MPSGRLREWRTGADRADAIVITKCPDDLTDEQRKDVIEAMEARPHQRIFFSKYGYGQPWLFQDPRYSTQLGPDWDVLLVTAIARVDYLKQHLEAHVGEVHDVSFGDHHDFTKRDIGRINRLFKEIENPKKIILTTEKDAMRLYAHAPYLRENKLPIFALPALVQFFPEAPGQDFDSYIRNRLLSFRA